MGVAVFLWCRRQLDQGMYCTTLEARKAGPTCVAMVTMDAANGTTPHYEDEALNIYETILCDSLEDNCKNAELECLKGQPGDATCGGDHGDVTSSRRRCSNDYVLPVNVHS